MGDSNAPDDKTLTRFVPAVEIGVEADSKVCGVLCVQKVEWGPPVCMNAQVACMFVITQMDGGIFKPDIFSLHAIRVCAQDEGCAFGFEEAKGYEEQEQEDNNQEDQQDLLAAAEALMEQRIDECIEAFMTRQREAIKRLYLEAIIELLQENMAERSEANKRLIEEAMEDLRKQRENGGRRYWSCTIS
jgi:hypothetical protein